MSVERIFIVGDKFELFAKNANVLAVSELEAILDSDLIRPHLRFQLGQGVSEERIARLLEKTASLKKPWLTDLVFAAQAKVPADRADRLRIAQLLVRAAEADPSRRVVVKLRAAEGEHQTHAEQDGYPELLAALGPLPANLVTSTAPMRDALSAAEGLVTVSSTAAIEAIARGIPVIALDTFGVSARLINETLADADLLGSEDDVVARRFRHPDPEWLEENYFHAPHSDDWMPHLEDLLETRSRGLLPPRPTVRRRGGALRDAWERKVALGSSDASVSGAVAYAIGVPLRAAVRWGRRVRAGQQPGPWGSSVQVWSTSAVRTSTTRMS